MAGRGTPDQLLILINLLRERGFADEKISDLISKKDVSGISAIDHAIIKNDSKSAEILIKNSLNLRLIEMPTVYQDSIQLNVKKLTISDKQDEINESNKIFGLLIEKSSDDKIKYFLNGIAKKEDSYGVSYFKDFEERFNSDLDIFLNKISDQNLLKLLLLTKKHSDEINDCKMLEEKIIDKIILRCGYDETNSQEVKTSLQKTEYSKFKFYLETIVDGSKESSSIQFNNKIIIDSIFEDNLKHLARVQGLSKKPFAVNLEKEPTKEDPSLLPIAQNLITGNVFGTEAKDVIVKVLSSKKLENTPVFSLNKS